MAKVSIIIPAYNRSFLIGETLNSILKQSYQDWECIVVDDHSTDDTVKRVLQYINKDPRIKLAYNERKKGAQGARNSGIAKSSGEFIVFLDSDDLLSTDCLSYRINFSVLNPGYDFYCFPTAVFKKIPYDTNLMWNYLNNPQDDLIRFLNSDIPWHTSGVLWLKDTLLHLKGWDEKLTCWQDWDIHVRALIDPTLKYMKVSNGNVDTFYRVGGSYNPISKREFSQSSIMSKMYLIGKFMNLLPFEKENVKFEFARLIYRVSLQIAASECKNEAVPFFNKHFKSLNFSKNYSRIWCFYFYHRHNSKFPYLFLKVLGIIPKIYGNKSLRLNQSTHMTAEGATSS